jgi:hypothetical protein
LWLTGFWPTDREADDVTDKILTIADSAHSPLGPSSASRWINCSASVKATADIPNESSVYAMEGTAAHGVAEECDRLQVRAEHFAGWTIRVDRSDGKQDFVCDQEMVDGVNAFLDYVDDLPGISLCEMMVKYHWWVEDGFGTLDRAKVDGTTLHVADFKYGKGVEVAAHDNTQLKIYAAGFWQEWGWLFPEIKDVVLHIVQPRIGHFDSYATTLAAILDWMYTVVDPAAKRTKASRPPFKAGDWCRFCKIRATCMVRASYVVEAVTGEFDELEDLDAAIDKEPLSVATLSNEQIARILPKLDSVQSWAKAIKAHAAAEVAAGRAVGTFKLVEGRSNREWAVTPEEVNLAVGAAAIPDFDPGLLWSEPELLPPAQAEKVLGKHKKILKPLIVKPKGKPTLAPAEDPRPALDSVALSEFEDLDASAES